MKWSSDTELALPRSGCRGSWAWESNPTFPLRQDRRVCGIQRPADRVRRAADWQIDGDLPPRRRTARGQAARSQEAGHGNGTLHRAGPHDTGAAQGLRPGRYLQCTQWQDDGTRRLGRACCCIARIRSWPAAGLPGSFSMSRFRPIPHTAHNSGSITLQSNQGVHMSSFARRNHAGQRSGGDHQHTHQGEGCRISWRYTIELVGKNAGDT